MTTSKKRREEEEEADGGDVQTTTGPKDADGRTRSRAERLLLGVRADHT